MTIVDDICRAADALTRARFVAVLSGAGMSKESGIPTFREAQTGMWVRFDPAQLATPTAFQRDPGRVWAWYQYRKQMVEAASPNPGHTAIAEMEGLVDTLIVLTQNVDGLHSVAGSRDVVELHGNLRRFKCSADCHGSPTIVDLAVIEYDNDHAPPCPDCGARVRPDVVWFGETLPPAALEMALRAAGECEVMLVVGTSGAVQPAASLPLRAKQSGATIIEINPQPSEITPIAHIFVECAAGIALPQIVSRIKNNQAQVPARRQVRSTPAR